MPNIENIAKPIEFIVSNDNVPKALKMLGRWSQKNLIIRSIKNRTFFEKPSEKALRKSKECDRRRKKALRDRNR
jgi:small subunit ribosomal protein S21